MTIPDAEMKSTWSSVFERKGGDGAYTKLFDHLNAMQQKKLLSNVKLNETEAPVVGSVPDNGNWLLLTTDRLVWSANDKAQEIQIASVGDAKADLEALAQNARTKLSLQHLQVVTLSDAEFTIELEAGKPLVGVWNILKNIGTRNRNLLK